MELSQIYPALMDAHTTHWLFKKQAEEFLTMMGYEPTPKLIRRFAAYLKHFDQCYPLATFYP